MQKLQVGDIIEVFGWCMLQKLDAGKYRISRIGEAHGKPTYCFTKPKGRTVIVQHYVHKVDLWVNDANGYDLNKIVVISPKAPEPAVKTVIVSCDEDGIDVSACPVGVIVEIHRGNRGGKWNISRYDHNGKIETPA